MPRLTLVRTAWAVVGLLVLLLLLAAAVTLLTFTSLGQALHAVVVLEEPANAAAYELEINVLGTGLSVLSYLDSPDPALRARVADDADDFARFHAQLTRLAEDPPEQALAARLAPLYDEYHNLSVQMMDRQDRLVPIFEELEAASLQMTTLGNELQGGLAARLKDHPAPVDALELEAGIATLHHWFDSVRHGGSVVESTAGMATVGELRIAIGRLHAQPLIAAERAMLLAIEQQLDTMVGHVQEVVSLQQAHTAQQQHFFELRETIDALLDESVQVHTTDDLAAATADADGEIRRSMALLGAMLLLGLGVMGGVGVGLWRRIVVPLRVLQGEIARLGDGAFEQPVARPAAPEIAALQHSFNQMAFRRRQVEAELRASEVQRRAVLDSLDAHIAVLDEAGTITAVNQAWEQFGQTNGLAPGVGGAGANYLAVCERAEGAGAEDAQEVLRGIRAVLAGGREQFSHIYTCHSPHSPQEQRWFMLSATPLRGGAGGGVVVAHINITERVRAEAAVRGSQLRLNGILGSAMDAIITIDAAHRIVLFNRAAEQIFRCSADEMLGHTLDRFIPGAARTAHRRHIEAFATAGVTNRRMGSLQALSALRADGTTFPIEATISQIVIDGQKLVTVIIRDATERVRAEEERRALERQMLETQKLESLGVLAGGVAHDFNNLLATMMGNAELAQLDVPPDSSAHESLGQIALAARRAGELTHQLLAYAGKGRLQVEAIDLNALIREMMVLLDASIPKHVALHTKLAACLPVIAGDAGQLRQVVMNVLLNAAEACAAPAGAVTLTTVQCVLEEMAAGPEGEEALSAGDYVRLEVVDTGIGMDGATLRRIFEPFFTTKFTGRGLGLAAVQGIVQQHGGRIQVQSAPGVGTRITILLPARDENPEEALAGEQPFARTVSVVHRTAAPLVEGRRAVLVIDDEDGVRTLVARTLERFGYIGLTAADGLAGVELFRAHQHVVACVLLDATMPGLNGEQTARAIWAIRPTVPTVLMSGYDAQEVLACFGEQELVRFLHKPFPSARLRTLLEEVVATAAEDVASNASTRR